MSSTVQGRAAGSLVRLFRVLARVPPDFPHVLELIRDQDVAAPILRRLAAGEEPPVTDLRHGVAAVYALLREHASEAGPLIQGASVGTVEEMRLFLDRRPQGVRRLAAITLLWGARLGDLSAVNGCSMELWAERFTLVLTGSDSTDSERAILAMLKCAEALLPEATPRAGAQAELSAIDALLDDLKRNVAANVTTLDQANELTRRLRRARQLMDLPISNPYTPPTAT